MGIDLWSDEVPINVSDAKAVQKAVEDMVEDARGLLVTNDESYKSITSLYKRAREWKKSLESKRKELVDPFRTQISEINDKAKTLSDPLDLVIELANAKANAYVRLVEQRKREADEEIREAAALFDAQDEVYIPPLDKVLRGDGAVAVTKIEKRFRVVDISKVPTKYLLIDEKAVLQDLKLGINAIEGLEIYEEQKTQLRVR